MISKQENPTRKGQELELEIESLVYGGLGLAKLDDFVVFVKGGLPGQTVLGHIYKKKTRADYSTRPGKIHQKIGEGDNL